VYFCSEKKIVDVKHFVISGWTKIIIQANLSSRLWRILLKSRKFILGQLIINLISRVAFCLVEGLCWVVLSQSWEQPLEPVLLKRTDFFFQFLFFSVKRRFMWTEFPFTKRACFPGKTWSFFTNQDGALSCNGTYILVFSPHHCCFLHGQK